MTQKKVKSLNYETTPECVYFVFRVTERGEDDWGFQVRYSELRSLNRILKSSDGIKRGELPAFPPKKLFGSGDPEFLKERQTGLENYLNGLLANPKFCNNTTVKKFFSMKLTGSRKSSLGGSRKDSNSESTPSGSVKRSSTASDKKQLSAYSRTQTTPRQTPRDTPRETPKETPRSSQRENPPIVKENPKLLNQPEKENSLSSRELLIQSPKENTGTPKETGLGRDLFPAEKSKERPLDKSKEIGNFPNANSLTKERLIDSKQLENEPNTKSRDEPHKFVLTKSGNLIDNTTDKEVENFSKKSKNIDFPIGNIDRNKKAKEKPLGDENVYMYCKSIFCYLCKR